MPRYYSIYIANRGRLGLQWSLAYATALDAQRHGQRLLDAGNATMCAVVSVDGERVQISRIKPESARKVCGHYEDMLGLVARWGRMGPPN